MLRALNSEMAGKAKQGKAHEMRNNNKVILIFRIPLDIASFSGKKKEK